MKLLKYNKGEKLKANVNLSLETKKKKIAHNFP